MGHYNTTSVEKLQSFIGKENILSEILASGFGFFQMIASTYLVWTINLVQSPICHDGADSRRGSIYVDGALMMVKRRYVD